MNRGTSDDCSCYGVLSATCALLRIAENDRREKPGDYQQIARWIESNRERIVRRAHYLAERDS